MPAIDMTVVKQNATDFVDQKFTIATDYADAAQAALESFLVDMSNQLTDYTGQALVIDAVTFPTPYVPAEVSNSAPIAPTIPDTPLAADLLVAHEDDVSVSAVNVNLLSNLNAALTTSKILSSAEEQALYDRMLGRKDAENERLEANATNLWASRGFEVPQGPLLAQIAEAAVEQSRNTLEVNAEILGKSGELAMQAASVALQSAVTYEQTWLGNLNLINDRAVRVKVENVGRVLQSYATIAKVLTDTYSEEVRAYGAEVQATVGIETLKLQANENDARIQAQEKATILQEAELKLKNKQTVLQLQIESLKVSASVSAQVVASALNSVNASASFGFQGGASEGTSNSFSSDLTKGIVSKSVSENVSYTGPDLDANTNPPLAG